MVPVPEPPNPETLRLAGRVKAAAPAARSENPTHVKCCKISQIQIYVMQ